jgi:hypothetical protein
VRGIAINMLIALLICLAAIGICSGPAKAADYQFNDFDDLLPNYYTIIADFYAQDGAQLSFEVTGVNDSRVDVLLMDVPNFHAYTEGPNFVYLPTSCLNVDYVYETTDFGALVSGTEYILLIDNSIDPSDGAMPGGKTVEFSYSVQMLNVELAGEKTANFFIFVSIAMFGGMLAIFVILFWAFRTKLNRQPYESKRMKQCPGCQTYIPEKSPQCPKCGNRF